MFGSFMLQDLGRLAAWVYGIYFCKEPDNRNVERFIKAVLRKAARKDAASDPRLSLKERWEVPCMHARAVKLDLLMHQILSYC